MLTCWEDQEGHALLGYDHVLHLLYYLLDRGGLLANSVTHVVAAVD